MNLQNASLFVSCLLNLFCVYSCLVESLRLQSEGKKLNKKAATEKEECKSKESSDYGCAYNTLEHFML